MNPLLYQEGDLVTIDAMHQKSPAIRVGTSRPSLMREYPTSKCFTY